MINRFKKNLRVKKRESKKELEDSTVKEIDEEISANIAKTLFEMQNNSQDLNKRKQILDRMLNINNLFKKGFDNEIKKLKEIEAKENER